MKTYKDYLPDKTPKPPRAHPKAVRLDDEAHRILTKLAAKHGTTMSDMAKALIQAA